MERLIERSLATLGQLPGLTVSYRLETREGRPPLYDAMVSVRTQKGTDSYAAEAKPSTTARSAASLLSQLRHIRQDSGTPPMLITDYAAPALADLLESHGIAYADLAGNAFLNGPAAYVRVRGNKAKRSPSRTGLTRTDLELVFALLAHPPLLRQPLRWIAETTGVSLGKISQTLRTLGELRLIRHQGEQRAMLDPARLLNRWEVGYLETVRPDLHPSPWKLGPTATLHETYRLAAEQPDVLIGGEFAADAMTRFLAPGSLTLHTRGDTKRIEIALRLRPATTDPDVVLLQRFMPSLDRWDQDTPAMPAPLAHPLLVRAELLASGNDRLREVADRLRDQLILPGLRDDG